MQGPGPDVILGAEPGQAGVFEHDSACDPAQRYGLSVRSMTRGEVVAFDHRYQVPGWIGDQRRMDVVVAEEVPDLADGGTERMPHRGREHRLRRSVCHLVHGLRLESGMPLWPSPVVGMRQRS